MDKAGLTASRALGLCSLKASRDLLLCHGLPVSRLGGILRQLGVDSLAAGERTALRGNGRT